MKVWTSTRWKVNKEGVALSSTWQPLTREVSLWTRALEPTEMLVSFWVFILCCSYIIRSELPQQIICYWRANFSMFLRVYFSVFHLKAKGVTVYCHICRYMCTFFCSFLCGNFDDHLEHVLNFQIFWVSYLRSWSFKWKYTMTCQWKLLRGCCWRRLVLTIPTTMRSSAASSHMASLGCSTPAMLSQFAF